jgi:hypothetical protein
VLANHCLEQAAQQEPLPERAGDREVSAAGSRVAESPRAALPRQVELPTAAAARQVAQVPVAVRLVVKPTPALAAAQRVASALVQLAPRRGAPALLVLAAPRRVALAPVLAALRRVALVLVPAVGAEEAAPSRARCPPSRRRTRCRIWA